MAEAMHFNQGQPSPSK
uniref:Uncharacterized protein n=1 Tax=Anguilla anguilla TaxID=7936 RepID=A0A0E9UG91_ANGAN